MAGGDALNRDDAERSNSTFVSLFSGSHVANVTCGYDATWIVVAIGIGSRDSWPLNRIPSR